MVRVLDMGKRPPKGTQFVDVVERHPDLYRGDPTAADRLEDCPLCGTPHCGGHPEPEVKQRRRKAPPRRTERPVPIEPDPAADPSRLVTAKQDCYEDVVLPGCVDPVSVLRIVKGQLLPMHEAEALHIEWQEQDGPVTFHVSFKDGVPVVLEPSEIIFADEDDFVPPEEREPIE